jgi:uncharacterized phage-associated protein
MIFVLEYIEFIDRSEFGEKDISVASVNAVADYILSKLDMSAGDSITPLKLQKLVYYSQVYHLVRIGTSLFDDPIEAWAHGPVVRALYERFKYYEWQNIPPTEIITDPFDEIPKESRKIIDEVFDEYNEYSAKRLEELTHSEKPWIDAYGDLPMGAACKETIRHESMKNFYAEII